MNIQLLIDILKLMRSGGIGFEETRDHATGCYAAFDRMRALKIIQESLEPHEEWLNMYCIGMEKPRCRVYTIFK